jgi:hypothetical protein
MITKKTLVIKKLHNNRVAADGTKILVVMRKLLAAADLSR